MSRLFNQNSEFKSTGYKPDFLYFSCINVDFLENGNHGEPVFPMSWDVVCQEGILMSKWVLAKEEPFSHWKISEFSPFDMGISTRERNFCVWWNTPCAKNAINFSQWRTFMFWNHMKLDSITSIILRSSICSQKLGGTLHIVSPPSSKVGGDMSPRSPPQRRPCE